ncbi:hypothetical protein [Pseudomonas fluorescens]|uniref:hypothetical protein n=1 Tax=Pseudomonas fluorescens TaxID=294 RepID=UPI000A4A8900|nr:hypothetical protein [Pseudomonas fluorescens]
MNVAKFIELLSTMPQDCRIFIGGKPDGEVTAKVETVCRCREINGEQIRVREEIVFLGIDAWK